jgi:hypothetical protein
MRQPFHGRLLTAAAVLALVACGASSQAEVDAASAPPLPEFTHRASAEWINSKPLTLADLRGRVVLLDVWTFDCWNCYRSFPWLKGVEKRLASQPFTAVGVHSPEFDHERERPRIERKVREFGIAHPVMIDNDFSYWRALGNRYWPSFYVIDKAGRVRGAFVGETHPGDAQARRIEKLIDALLAEPAPQAF